MKQFTEETRDACDSSEGRKDDGQAKEKLESDEVSATVEKPAV